MTGTIEISKEEYKELLYCRNLLYEALSSYFTTAITTEMIVEDIKHQAELMKRTKNPGETCTETEGKISE